MALMPQIFVSGEFGVDTLRLKHDADLAAEAGGILGGIVSHDHGAARGRNHERRKDPEERGLAAAVRPEQAEQFCRTHVEGNAVQRRAVLVAMDQVFVRKLPARKCDQFPERHRRVRRLSKPKEFPRDC